MKPKRFWCSSVFVITAFFIAVLFIPKTTQAMLMIMNTPPYLLFSSDSGYNGDSGVDLSATTALVFKVVYTDDQDDAPVYVRLVLDGIIYPMSVDASQNNDYYEGKQYFVAIPLNNLNPSVAHSYYFETSDWESSARLPNEGEMTFGGGTRPVIIIPGLLGSQQKDGVWVMDPIMHTYDNLLDTFKANGYTENVNLFTLPYDWRRSNVETAKLLKNKIEEVKQVCQCDKVDLVAHSMGGLVARQYIESSDYGKDVDQLIFLGTPHLGAPKAYLSWEAGEFTPDLVDQFIGFMIGREAKKLGYGNSFDYVVHFPISSIQELLPTYNYLRDGGYGLFRLYPTGYPSNPFLDKLNDSQHLSLFYNSGVKITNIIGDAGDGSTISSIRVSDSEVLPLWRDGYPENFWEKIGDRGLENGKGDGTVPEISSSYVDKNIVKVHSEHVKLPTAAQVQVYEDLTNHDPQIVVTNKSKIDFKFLIIKILSPADIVVIAPDGKRAGKDFATNQEINEIDGAFYSGFQTDNQFVTIPNPVDGSYKVEVKGKDNGGEYTVATGYLSNTDTAQSDFQSTILPGQVTELQMNVNTSAPQELAVRPIDHTPPQITISSPLAQDYTRADNIVLAVTSTDADSGMQSQSITLDGIIMQSGETIDPFTKTLGDHFLLVTSSDWAGNIATASVSFRLVATPTSAIQDIQKMFALGWITKISTRNTLINTLKTMVRLEKMMVVIKKYQVSKKSATRIEKIVERIDRQLGKKFLQELEKRHEKTINDQAYSLLIEDINWLLK